MYISGALIKNTVGTFTVIGLFSLFGALIKGTAGTFTAIDLFSLFHRLVRQSDVYPTSR